MQVSPQNSQLRLSPDEAKAALGIGNNLIQGLLPKSPETAQNASQNASQSQPIPQEGMQPSEDITKAKFTEVESKMETMKAELEAMIKAEISGIKDIIIDALKDDDKDDNTE